MLLKNTRKSKTSRSQRWILDCLRHRGTKVQNLGSLIILTSRSGLYDIANLIADCLLLFSPSQNDSHITILVSGRSGPKGPTKSITIQPILVIQYALNRTKKVTVRAM